MTGLLIFFAILISTIFAVDFSRTIFELREQRVALKSTQRKAGGFDV